MSTETVAQQVPTGTWVVDPVHSNVQFAITHSGVASFRGGFGKYDATFEGGESPVLAGSVEVASIELPDEQLKGHLLSPDFFDAGAHPRFEFRSTELDVAEDGSVRLRGELELRGRKREVEASGSFGRVAAYLDGRERIGLSLETTIDRREFGIDWNADLPQGGRALEYEVTIGVDLQFVPQES
jgi:polyisoprenoid-binding protein YceI